MLCKKCNMELIDTWKLCPWCGRKQVRETRRRVRGNGQGSVYKDGNFYRATVVLGYYLDEKGTKHKKTRSQLFRTRTEAMEAVGTLKSKPNRSERPTITFKALYDKWLPTHEASKSTIDCYKAAFKYFEPIWFSKMEDLDIDDLQDCLDECGKGKRTQQNMKAVAGLVFKYGIPRDYVAKDRNLAPFLKVRGEDAVHRESFSNEQIESIRKLAVEENSFEAKQVYCLIYLGLRPSEFLDLNKESYDIVRQCVVGGAKTAAGKGRTVTVSPKIQGCMAALKAARGTAFLSNKKGERYTLQNWTDTVFYPVLEAAGIENPMVEIAEGIQRHKYSPHSCRHTFSTLMKRVAGADKDKLELIGHTSDEMLRYYQDVSLEDLKKITDKI